MKLSPAQLFAICKRLAISFEKYIDGKIEAEVDKGFEKLETELIPKRKGKE